MSTPRSLQALLGSAIDYSGVFPPASLDMPASVAGYDTYRRGNEAWMLGRFVVPAARLSEFADAAVRVLPRAPAPPWSLCAVAGAGASHDLSEIDMFNRRHDGRSVSGRAVVELVEVKVSSLHDVRALDESMPRGTRMVCEVVAGNALAPTLQAIRDVDGIAKVRTGGVTPEAVPSTEALADFLLACHVARVSFKATGGLQHAISATHPLTSEPGAPRVRMHGFVNVLVAAALVHAAPRVADPRLRTHVVGLLDEGDSGAFVFSDDGVRWRNFMIKDTALAESRAHFGVSFGSCSFEEPLADLKAMGLEI